MRLSAVLIGSERWLQLAEMGLEASRPLCRGYGELMLGLRGHGTGVAEDAHHLVGRKEREAGSAKKHGKHFI